MNDDIGRRLRAARPPTDADNGWAGSADGDRALDAIHRAAADTPTGSRLRTRLLVPVSGRRPGRSLAYGAVAAAVVAGIAVSLAGSGTTHRGTSAGSQAGTPPAVGRVGPRPSEMALVAYTDCGAMLAGLRDHTAAHVSAEGLPGSPESRVYSLPARANLRATSSAALAKDAAQSPQHSSTNDQESGVDEPDLVKTDGDRVVSVSGGVLRVLDAATRKTTGRLDLSMYAGAQAAQLLVSGERALVVLADIGPQFGGPVVEDDAYPGANPGSTYLLIDLASKPTIIATLHPKGAYVDARLVGGTVRLVVQSSPILSFPRSTRPGSTKVQAAANKALVRHAPLDSWLPSYEVTAGGMTTTRSVPCQQVRHPVSYTGTSLLTVYTLDMAAGFGDVSPVSLAADGATVYATPSSLYVASEPATAQGGNATTQLHRFDISGTGPPTYLGSGTVPGRLLSSYSLSDYDGHLRVVTTSGDDTGKASSAVYVLDAGTLKTTGHVGGLGAREQVYAVRFIGALAYVVTYRSVDPLYVLDLSDPAKPRKAGELRVTGYSDYLHPTSDGRLLGVGQVVNGNGVVAGLQISLFDVTSPSHPRRIARVVRQHTPSEDTIDPHAFLYWAPTHTAIVPIRSWDSAQSGAVVVLHVGTNDLRTIGTIANPATTDGSGYNDGIERSLVIGGAIWTMSQDGFAVTDSATLHRQAWIPFT